MAYIVTRDITKKECPWLDEDVPSGTVVYAYRKYTYGCISSEGIAVHLYNQTEFFELPKNAIEDW